jgi:signal transduction histidine kinase
MNPRQFLRQLFASADLSEKENPSWIFLLRILIASALGLSLTFLKVDYIESYLYDLRVRYSIKKDVSPHIEIILTDLQTHKALGRPEEYGDYNKALSFLKETIPRFIVFVPDSTKDDEGDKIEFRDVRGSEQSKIEFIEHSKYFFHFYHALPDPDPDFQFPKPFDELKTVFAPRTYDKNIGARDQVTRRMIINIHGRDTLYPLAAKTFNPSIVDPLNIRGNFEFYGSIQTYIDFHPKGSFSTTKLEDLVAGKVPASKFHDKIVLFGSNLENSYENYVLTPFSRNPSSMPLVEMQANMLETLINNSGPVKPPPWINILLTILISIFTVHVALTLKPVRGIFLLFSGVILILIFSYVMYWPFGVWIQITHPLLAIFLCYYFFIPYRLIIENRRSWEYFQKHKLLSEVELLKTNFIGMMSHDLKTPLARIQGMAEMIVRDKNPLTSNQTECLDTIKQSSDDLTKFINTILNYARIESQGIELNLKNKDPNQLVEDVVKKHDFLAKLRHIQLITELEPLFTIQIDPELIRQVISNLVENAIKYSPEKSKVLITTEDAGDRVLIQVADQGIGLPSDEVENIFSKFYRSKNAKSSPVKGSGLGLYLSRYFVELHKGRILVESSEGQGSTFTVELPVSHR